VAGGWDKIDVQMDDDDFVGNKKKVSRPCFSWNSKILRNTEKVKVKPRLTSACRALEAQEE
jgi:hypothetical protein